MLCVCNLYIKYVTIFMILILTGVWLDKKGKLTFALNVPTEKKCNQCSLNSLSLHITNNTAYPHSFSSLRCRRHCQCPNTTTSILPSVTKHKQDNILRNARLPTINQAASDVTFYFSRCCKLKRITPRIFNLSDKTYRKTPFSQIVL